MENLFTRWIARDKDNTLWMHSIKPENEDGFYVSDRRSFEIFSRDYPEFANITYENGPVQVDFFIKG